MTRVLHRYFDAAGRVLRLFGAGHSRLLALDAYGRAPRPSGTASLRPGEVVGAERNLELVRPNLDRGPGRPAGAAAAAGARPGDGGQR